MKRPVVPDGPEPPALLLYLWELFFEISMGLAVSGMAPPVVTWEGLLAWRTQMGIELAPWETRAIVRLGYLRAMVLSEEKPKPPPKAGANGRSNQN